MRLHGIVAAGCCRPTDPRAEAADVTGQLPDLIGGQALTEGGHPVRPAITDRKKDRDPIWSVAPPAVHQGGSAATPAIGMAALAIEPGIETLALAKLIGVAFIRVGERAQHGRGCAIDPVRHGL